MGLEGAKVGGYEGPCAPFYAKHDMLALVRAAEIFFLRRPRRRHRVPCCIGRCREDCGAVTWSYPCGCQAGLIVLGEAADHVSPPSLKTVYCRNFTPWGVYNCT